MQWSEDDAKRLKRYRKDLRLTQELLGKRLGLGQATICRLEKGKQLSPFILAAVRLWLNYDRRGA